MQIEALFDLVKDAVDNVLKASGLLLQAVGELELKDLKGGQLGALGRRG